MVPSAAVWSIERRVGRLVEIRIWSPVSIEETGPWQIAHDDVIRAIGGPYVCFVDLADATVFPQDIVDAYVATMKNEPLLIRTATLLNASPTLGMQIQRMIREADNPDRRVFREAAELAGWLGAVLDDAERHRLEELLFERHVTIPPKRG